MVYVPVFILSHAWLQCAHQMLVDRHRGSQYHHLHPVGGDECGLLDGSGNFMLTMALSCLAHFSFPEASLSAIACTASETLSCVNSSSGFA